MEVKARFIASGTAAGAFSAFIFCVVHQLLISPIWFATVAMLVAGAVCGTLVAWSYTVAVDNKSVRSWMQYNALYVVILFALGIASLIAFEPVTSIAKLLESNEPPRALIGRALPITGVFTVGSAALLTLIYRPRWIGALALLLTAVGIVAFLGLNISILGLVFVPRSSLYVIAEVLALIVTLALVYAAAIAYAWRATLTRKQVP
jgi:hypothetical protein